MVRESPACLPRVAGVVLAAGISQRFGSSKALLTFRGEAFVHHAARQACEAGLSEVVLVLGHLAREVGESVRDLAIRTVVNPDYRAGQSSSVATGVRALRAETDAAIFIPCDQPWLDAELLIALIAAYRAARQPIVVPAFEGRRGSPALVDRSLFDELLKLEGDRGARQIFSRHEARIFELPLSDGRQLIDIDTREAYEEMVASEEPSPPD